VVAFLNYCYHPIISRLLSVNEFGEIVAVLSLMTQTGVVLGVFSLLGVHHTANKDHQDQSTSRLLLKEIYSVVFWLMLIMSIGMVLYAPTLMRELKFDSIAPFIIMALITLVSVPYSLGTSELQGKRKFKELSYASFMQSAGKLVFSILLAWVGFGVFGALAGIFIAQLAVLFYLSDWKVRNIEVLPKIRPTFDYAFMREMRYAGLILLTTMTIAFLYTLDTVIVKYYFTPVEAGLYGGMAVIARIVYFVTASISGVLLPSVTLALPKRERYRILFKSAVLVILIGAVALAAMITIPSTITSILIGSSYQSFAHYLPKLALMLFFASCINLFAMFLLAQRKFILFPIMLIGLIFLALITLGSHATIDDIIGNFLTTNLAVLIMLSAYLFYDYKEKSK
jgi:O-antigen/teichoic acid export membrane protein